jgi:hypothetical protein
MTDAVKWLSEWYIRNCNGDWEHEFGVTIDTLDNPGWKIKIDLVRTSMEDMPFDEIHVNVEPSNPEQGGGGLTSWWICKVVEGAFVAYCGPRDLDKVMGYFENGWSGDSVIVSTNLYL